MGQHWSHVQGNRKEGARWRLLDWTQRVVLEFVLLRQVLSLPHGQDGSHICFVLLWLWQSSSLPRLARWFSVLLQGVRRNSPQSPPHFPLQVQRTALPGLRHSFQWGVSFPAPAVAPWCAVGLNKDNYWMAILLDGLRDIKAPSPCWLIDWYNRVKQSWTLLLTFKFHKFSSILSITNCCHFVLKYFDFDFNKIHLATKTRCSEMTFQALV